MYAQLGSIKFEALRGFEALSDKKEAGYSEHALIDNKPRLQRSGSALQEFDMSIRFHVAFCDPESEYDALDKYREDGEVLPFVLGTGHYEGDFVITTLTRRFNQTDKDGNVVEMECDLNLKEFSQDQSRANQSRAKLNAFAVDPNRPTPASVPVPPLTKDAQILKAIADARAFANNIAANVSEFVDLVTRPATLLLQGQALAAEANGRATEMMSAGDSIAEAYTTATVAISSSSVSTVAPDLLSAITDSITKQSELETALSVLLTLPTVTTDAQAQFCLDALSDVQDKNDAFQTASNLVHATSAPLAAFSAMRKKL